MEHQHLSLSDTCGQLLHVADAMSGHHDRPWPSYLSAKRSLLLPKLHSPELKHGLESGSGKHTVLCVLSLCCALRSHSDPHPQWPSLSSIRNDDAWSRGVSCWCRVGT